jgi:hypothetical protein
VAISGDGNTAIVGGYGDNSGNGAAWVWTRSGATWTQQGLKLVASDGTWSARQGSSVALSANGNTAIVGGPQDGINSARGAAWIWTRTAGAWTQQGSKLVDATVLGVYQGSSVALSGDGNTAIVGGPIGAGAAWVYVSSSLPTPTAPTATTTAATAVGQSTATMNGTVSANGALTTVTFGYGLTTGYGATVTATQSPLAASASAAAVTAVANVYCGQTYHFHVIANNGTGGDIDGGDRTFNSSACPVATYPITANTNPAAGGTAGCTPNPVSSGGNSTCTATANGGYVFTGWSGACSGANCTLSNVIAAASVTANFAVVSSPAPAGVTAVPVLSPMSLALLSLLTVLATLAATTAGRKR